MKYLKIELPGYESPVPDDMWNRIIQKKNKDRKGFFFFFRLSGLFVLGFGIAYFLLFGIDKMSAIQERQKISNPKVVTIPVTADAKATDPNLSKAPSLSNEKSPGLVDSFQKKYRHNMYTNTANSIDPLQKKHTQKFHSKSAISKENKSAGILPTQSKKNSVTPSTGRYQVIGY